MHGVDKGTPLNKDVVAKDLSCIGFEVSQKCAVFQGGFCSEGLQKGGRNVTFVLEGLMYLGSNLKHMHFGLGCDTNSGGR